MNVASRLEGACKQYGLRLLISQRTREHAGGTIEARKIDSVAVKGKDEAVPVFDPLAAGGKLDDETARLRASYETGLAAYRGQDWAKAEEAFVKALEISPDDSPSVVMRARVLRLREINPPSSWDGVWRMRTK